MIFMPGIPVLTQRDIWGLSSDTFWRKINLLVTSVYTKLKVTTDKNNMVAMFFDYFGLMPRMFK